MTKMRKKPNHSLINGSGAKLAAQIRKNNGYGSDFKEHPWADSRVESEQCGLEAHHIITTKNLDTPQWKKYREAYEYDINSWENGVMFPSEPDIACQASTHVHRSNHNGGIDFTSVKTKFWKGKDPSVEVKDDVATYLRGLDYKYIKAVYSDIDSIKQNAKSKVYCKPGNKEKFTLHMNQKSKAILAKLNSFLYTISTYGHDYSPVSKVGCAGGDSENKSKNRGYCEHRMKNTSHGILNHQDHEIKQRTLKVGK
ncbi:AHH domain-containing protein [Vibrio owensii]|uniref:AHH domain-containing protein n=1 Tax=Vibrio owensii TaxID=696485 RepID=UPI002893F80E|nr:A nuclease family of the HNH/ENDO VII superfamily with conserved AHH [Vibrio owensii]